jgi:hypothetical protein
VARLAARGARVAITALPLASVARAGPLRYRLLRTVYVPGCRLSLAELRAAAERLDEAVRRIAAEHAARLVEQPGDWYGFDSIHVRRPRLDALWNAAADAWGPPGSRGAVARGRDAVHAAAGRPLARRRHAQRVLN